MDINNMDWDLPLAVSILLRRMRGDPAQRLTYQMSGDGCSTSLHLTWTSLTCPGCRGVRCPGRPRPAPRSRRPPRPRSWAMGGAFSYSSPEDEEGGSLSPLSPVLSSSMGESGGEEGEEEEEYLTEEQSEVEKETEKDTGAEEEEGEQSDSSIVTCRRGPPPLKHQLINTGESTSRGVNSLTLRPPPDGQLTDITTSSSEPEEEEEEQKNKSYCSPDPDSDSKYSSCKDSGLCLSDPGPSSNNRRGGGRSGGEVGTHEPSSPEVETPVWSSVKHRGVQTEEGVTRLVKRCHAVWAALEQLYVYYDDKEGVLRVSDVDSGQLVVDATRTEATLRYLHGAEGHIRRVVMEIVWVGSRGVDSC